jgi:hypothetical protein
METLLNIFEQIKNSQFIRILLVSFLIGNAPDLWIEFLDCGRLMNLGDYHP